MRLIDANALKNAIEQYEGISWDSYGKDDLCVRKKYIDNAPTVETQIEHFVDMEKLKSDCLNCGKFEKLQGEWISNNADDNSFINRGIHCSLCGKTVEFSENYCPQCGAYMRGNNHV